MVGLNKLLSNYQGTNHIAPIAKGLNTIGWRGLLDCSNGDCGDDSGQDCSTETYES